MPMGPLDTRYSRQVPSDVPLPARMCTVSHCHKILPGFYRYKRCETHRIQNRWHSKLKRGREKIEKGFMLPDGTPLVAPGPIKVKRNTQPKEKKPRKKRETTDKEPAGTEGTSGDDGNNVEGGEATNDSGMEQSPDNDNLPEKARSPIRLHHFMQIISSTRQVNDVPSLSIHADRRIVAT